MFSDDKKTFCFPDGSKYFLNAELENYSKDDISSSRDVFECKSVDGRDVILTRWYIDLTGLNEKCPITCEKIGYSRCECSHNVQEIIEEFMKSAKFIIEETHHVNLVPYLNAECTVSDQYLHVNLVQESIEGVNIKRLFEQGVEPELPLLVECVLRAICHIHSKNPKIKHGNISRESVFLDKSGVYRTANFYLIPYLMYLKEDLLFIPPSMQNDLQSLEFLLYYGITNIQRLVIDIEKCWYSTDILPCCDLVFNDDGLAVVSGEFNSIYNGPFLKNFEIEGQCGSGSFGNVIKAKRTNEQDTYALKLVAIPDESKVKSDKVKRESQIISKLNHRNVIKCIRTWEQEVDSIFYRLTDESNLSRTSLSQSLSKSLGQSSSFKNTLIIQMELCDMTLKNAMKNFQEEKKPIPNQWYFDIARGLTYLHFHGIIHRDLNPNNVLLDFSGNFKIADFGLATNIILALKQKQKSTIFNGSISGSSSLTGKVGTSYYVAPELRDEIASKSTYGTESDIYSLGMIFFEMRHPPFGTDMERHIVLTDAGRNKIPDFMDNDYMTTIIRRMLDHDSKKRSDAIVVDTDLNRIFIREHLDSTNLLTENKEEIIKHLCIDY